MSDSPLSPEVTEMLYGKPVPVMNDAVRLWKFKVKEGKSRLEAAEYVRDQYNVSLADLHEELNTRGLI